ncbi:GNAT family N-acetyltransferase [Halobacillus sp. Marseille-P3879]|uniref:GNAT family N-acetyltransferase n=1 Tax=Halobacillus sp. Marseille-P3879 TaxID=2045014 RepID=UPI000C7C7227|nr:GNAT family protein [Halobacillus sp. Marseille-P3879]
MIEVKGRKVVLKEATDKAIDELYFWKYEDKEQEAKKWNGPYIIEEKLSKGDYEKTWKQQLITAVPASLVITADEKTIGYVGAYWVDPNTDWLETGIVIYDKAYWNGGYGSEAYKLWIDFLFRHTHLHRLGMSTWSGNVRMIKVAEKLGMKEEARIREARKVSDQYYDAVKMGVLRKEWEAFRTQ